MLKVSIILPVYNVDKYLDKCIKSILNQTYENFEAIFVDDGSTDNSLNIIKSYALKDARIHFFTKENGGQGSARNLGLAKASGDYVIYVDPDDYISADYILELINTAVNSKTIADLVVCDYEVVYENKQEHHRNIGYNAYSDDAKKNYIVSMPGPVCKLIKRELLSNFTFLENKIYEDLATIPVLGLRANKIIYTKKPLYYYLQRTGSSMYQQTYNYKLTHIFDAVLCLKNSFDKEDPNGVYKQELEFVFINNLLYQASIRFLKYKEGKAQIKRIRSIMKREFPKFYRNPYFKQMKKHDQIVCLLIYFHLIFVIRLIQKLKGRNNHEI